MSGLSSLVARVGASTQSSCMRTRRFRVSTAPTRRPPVRLAPSYTRSLAAVLSSSGGGFHSPLLQLANKALATFTSRSQLTKPLFPGRRNLLHSTKATLSGVRVACLSMFSAQLSLAPVNQAGMDDIEAEVSMICESSGRDSAEASAQACWLRNGAFDGSFDGAKSQSTDLG